MVAEEARHSTTSKRLTDRVQNYRGVAIIFQVIEIVIAVTGKNIRICLLLPAWSYQKGRCLHGATSRDVVCMELPAETLAAWSY